RTAVRPDPREHRRAAAVRVAPNARSRVADPRDHVARDRALQRTARRLLHMDPAEARVPRQRVYARAVRGAATDVVPADRVAARALRGGVHIDRPVAAAAGAARSAL